MTFVLAVIALSLLYTLTLSEFSAPKLWKERQIASQKQLELEKFKSSNQRLVADINDLKRGTEAIEERAREELGLVKQGEIFYQVIPVSN
ncbi:MAG: cell division protein FtsB [Gammaproteobacteria bacterium]|nr:MAG: cell division protein FtsB [Gammaproteobacteria bacterium]RTZ62394.1 MAG: cell division protein FtsB [Gammaproteobacteria bacterium]